MFGIEKLFGSGIEQEHNKSAEMPPFTAERISQLEVSQLPESRQQLVNIVESLDK